MDRADMIEPLHGLRGIATVVILLHHMAPVDINGPMGLTLFFVLSGFLIGRLYMRREFDPIQLWRYGSSRFARIYPLFAVVILAAALVNTQFGLQVFELKTYQIDRHLLLLGSNMTIWTIAVECHFYAMFILLWWAVSRGWINRVTLVALYVALAVGPFFFDGRIHPLHYLHIFTLGVVVADFSRTPSPKAERLCAWALPMACAAYLGLVLTGLDAYQNPVCILVCGAVVYCSVQAQSSLTGRFLSLPLFVWLGEISYGLYLFHRFVQDVLVTKLGYPVESWPTFVIGSAATAVIATLVFKTYEDPMRRLLRAQAQRLELRYLKRAETG
ncbi:MAG: acyltransferase [Pseudomonadota bacterium]